VVLTQYPCIHSWVIVITDRRQRYGNKRSLLPCQIAVNRGQIISLKYIQHYNKSRWQGEWKTNYNTTWHSNYLFCLFTVWGYISLITEYNISLKYTSILLLDSSSDTHNWLLSNDVHTWEIIRGYPKMDLILLFRYFGGEGLLIAKTNSKLFQENE